MLINKTNKKMKSFLTKHWLKIAGVITGVIGGYLYYYFVGCVSGTCPITSNPYKMVFFGALLGYLFFSLFEKDTNKNSANSPINKK